MNSENKTIHQSRHRDRGGKPAASDESANQPQRATAAATTVTPSTEAATDNRNFVSSSSEDNEIAKDFRAICKERGANTLKCKNFKRTFRDGHRSTMFGGCNEGHFSQFKNVRMIDRADSKTIGKLFGMTIFNPSEI